MSSLASGDSLEASWIRRAKAGDTEAIEHLMIAIYPSVRRMVHDEFERRYRTARPWLQSMFSTGDVVQNVALDVMHGLDGFHGITIDALRAYLFKAVTNQLVDAVRWHFAGKRDVRRVTSNDSVDAKGLEGEGPSPSHFAVLHDEVACVTRILATLSDRDRRLIELRYRDTASFTEIARALSIPSADAARKAVQTARARLLVGIKRAKLGSGKRAAERE